MSLTTQYFILDGGKIVFRPQETIWSGSIEVIISVALNIYDFTLYDKPPQATLLYWDFVYNSTAINTTQSIENSEK